MEEDIQISRSQEKIEPKPTDFEIRRRRENYDTTSSNQSELLKSGQRSDFTIVCQHDIFNVHRAIILGHSEFFDSVINSTFPEGVEQKLDLSTEDPAALSMVLWFIYTGQLDYKNERHCLHKVKPEGDHENFLKLLIRVARLADFLLMYQCFRAVRYLFQLKVIGIVKGLGNTQTPSSYTALLECVSEVFAPDQDMSSNMIEIQKIIAWALVTGNSRKEDGKAPSLSTTDLDMLNKHFPTLGIHLYRDITEIEKDDPYCDGCEEKYVDSTQPRWAYGLTRDSTTKPRWISCICNFRGLCSIDCFTSDRPLCLLNTGCELCKGNIYPECGHGCGCGCESDDEFVSEFGFNHQEKILHQQRCSDKSPYYFKLTVSKPK